MKLRPIKREDYEYVLTWTKDSTFCLANGWEVNRNEEELGRWWDYCVTNGSEDFRRIGIEYDGRLIGYADLACIQDNRAEIGIAIGDSMLWGKGFGAEAVRMLIAYASDELGITTFTAETHEANNRSRKMLERLGFVEVSRIGVDMYKGEESQLIQYKLVQ